MKASNFFDMTNNELKVKLSSLKEELFHLRFKHKAGQLTNGNLLNICKKDIARVNTILCQREKNISVAPIKEEKASKSKSKK